MDPDLGLVLGLVLAVLSVPSVVSALSNGRAPRVAAIVMILGGGLLVYAIDSKPGGYRLQDMPDVFYGVIGRYIG